MSSHCVEQFDIMAFTEFLQNNNTIIIIIFIEHMAQEYMCCNEIFKRKKLIY